jgi:hypothetical protein
VVNLVLGWFMRSRDDSNQADIFHLVVNRWREVEAYKIDGTRRHFFASFPHSVRIETIKAHAKNHPPFIVWCIKEMLFIRSVECTKYLRIPNVSNYARCMTGIFQRGAL